MCSIISVSPMKNFRIKVQLDNGSLIILNMKSKLKTIRFMKLSDKELFNAATTNGRCIHWDNEIELSINEVFQITLKQKIKNTN